MKHVEGKFKGFGGHRLYYQSWHPEGPIQAIVVMVHGLGGHSDLFRSTVPDLLARQYEVYSFDLRGHGRSPGPRGHINTWTEFREDVRAFLQQIDQQRSGCSCPCFLWGHSLGGTIVLDYVLRSTHSLQGLIMTAPALEKVCVSPIKLALGQVLSGVFPRFSLKLGIREELCIREPEICMAYLQDPLRHEWGSARLATEFFTTVDWIYKHISNLQIPLLLLHGSADQVTFPEASRALFQRVSFSDKEYHEYPDGYHEIYTGMSYQAMLADVMNWMERHLEGATTCQSLTL